MKPVIICGGVGTKMWPMSRSASPKHFLPLIDGKSLFEINWEVLRKKFKADEIFLQTNAVQAEIAKKLVPEIRVRKKTHGFEKLLAFNYEATRHMASTQISRLEDSLDGIEYNRIIKMLKGKK